MRTAPGMHVSGAVLFPQDSVLCLRSLPNSMKALLPSAALTFLLSTSFVSAQVPAPTPAPLPASTAAPALKVAYQDFFRIGTAINRSFINGRGFRRTPEQVAQDIALVKEQFNQITAENDMKWMHLHPRPGSDGYDFGPTDAFVKFGEDNNLYLAGHVLVWHDQTPHWVFRAPGAGPEPAPEGPRDWRRGPRPFTGPKASREVLLERMKEHIHTVVTRYKGRIKVWDVVNEALADNGPDNLRKSLWLEIIGPDFIAKAFEYAHAADPDAILRYNDYGLESPAKRRRLIAVVKELQAAKVPIHAIGTQVHVNLGIRFEDMDQSLTEMAALGLPIHITELDVNTAQGGQRNTNADISGNAATTQGGTVSDAERQQAEVYASLFRAFTKHDKSVEMVTFWGSNDALSWRRDGKPLIFDGNNQPKPARDAILKVAAEAAKAGKP